MQTRTCRREDLAGARELWMSRFDDGTEGFRDFLFTKTPPENIFVGLEGDTVMAEITAAAALEYKGKKGAYLYSACTRKGEEGKGYMHRLAEYAVRELEGRGYSFFAVVPSDESLFAFWRELGFDNATYLRRAVIDIPKNIWQAAEFDITTAGRFRRMREKFADGEIVNYSRNDYSRYAEYLYTFGGSTAESKDAFAVYYEEGETLEVKELSARDTAYAVKLLQAIRERTGKQTAEIWLPADSSMFLGEGRKVRYAAVRGLSGDIYINLMFE